MYLPLNFYWDPTYVLILPALVLSLIAQITVSSRFSKYSRVPTMGAATGAAAAQAILSRSGVYNVAINAVRGSMNDHFDPRTNSIALSDPVYAKSTITAVAVAAHETGHALQYAEGYGPMRLRSSLAPVVQIASTLSLPIFIVGLIFGFTQIAMAGAIIFGLVFVFQLVTLPVEINASKRALAALGDTGMLSQEELRGAKKVLFAAAMTYVAATLMAFLQFLRLLLLSQRRR